MISVPFARSLAAPAIPPRSRSSPPSFLPSHSPLNDVDRRGGNTHGHGAALRWITGNLPAPPFTVVAIPVTHRTRGSGTGDGASECAGHEQMDCDITHVCFSVGRGC